MTSAVECKKQKDGDNGPILPFVLERVMLGKDEDGDPFTSLVASYHDNAEAILSTTKGFSRYELLLLDLIPLSGKLYGHLRDEFYEKCGSDKPDTKKKAFSRAFSALVTAGYIFEKGNSVFKKAPDG
jgi:hypothetical protein